MCLWLTTEPTLAWSLEAQEMLGWIWSQIQVKAHWPDCVFGPCLSSVCFFFVYFWDGVSLCNFGGPAWNKRYRYWTQRSLPASISFFWDTVSHSPHWPWIRYEVKEALDLWSYCFSLLSVGITGVLQLPVYVLPGLDPRTSCILPLELHPQPRANSYWIQSCFGFLHSLLRSLGHSFHYSLCPAFQFSKACLLVFDSFWMHSV